MPLISILICTLDHAASLRHTLASIAETSIPNGCSAEIIIIDNGSKDDTASVVNNIALPNASLRYIYEPQKGQSHARNAGIAASRGDIIVFTDDDVRVPRDWLAQLVCPLLDNSADAVAGGVRIADHLLRPWLEPLHRNWLASTERLGSPNPTDMVGANMAFQRRILERVSGFDTELGPGALGFGDDTLFAFQIKQAGYRLIASLGAPVVHYFDDNRLTRSHFIIAAHKFGKTEAYLLHHWHHGNIRYLRLRWIASLMRLWRWRLLNVFKHENDSIRNKEMHLIVDSAKYQRLLIERKRARNYSRYGLQKQSTDKVSTTKIALVY